MITKDFEVVQEIFSLISDGIVNGYDSFSFKAEVHSSYIESELLVSVEGNEISDAETDFNRAILYELIEKFKKGFADRGESWKSFTMTYTQGGKVETHFDY
ncbi:immunity protein YezG family protein [Pseudomonas savastanoi]|uniref:immunity protein YezG family protein n=1 Tax=Pseudomonas savastanoi TaxID=29438 RepID=UPI001E2DC489|nr:immunity protein YezG family protein [Pseudomonas savastanoi]UFI43044.1 antitoxin YezG family protein [Pseudomonas savastanoi]